ncbi:MAG: hypothetical protein O3A46_15900 [Candidatus Poribacteria bacterium]|nr:hypothetical protein [Candidatus Poribacteria bacterium]
MRRIVLAVCVGLVFGTVGGVLAQPPLAARIAFTYSRPGLNDSEIRTMNADGSDSQYVTQGTHPTWSPDGEKIAFAHKGALYTVNADGSDRRELLDLPGTETSPAWSPDGSRIAFEYLPNPAASQDCDIYLADADGRNPRNLTRRASDINLRPVWSPDSKRIAFSTIHERSEIWVIDAADGGNRRAVTDGLGFARDPSWSPDGARIAFASYRGLNKTWYDLFAVGANGGEVVPLADSGIDKSDTAWSPDGRHIAFSYRRTNPAGRWELDIYLLDVATGNAVPITDDARSYLPAWFDPTSLGVSPTNKKTLTWGGLKSHAILSG